MKTRLQVFLFLILGIGIIAFNAQLYILCDQQRSDISAVKEQQKIDAQVTENKFKYQQDKIDNLSKDLIDAQEDIKDQDFALTQQKDALLSEIQKRQQVDNEGKGIQTSLVDIKAETDAMKDSMMSWQKDYVSILAGLQNSISRMDQKMNALDDKINKLGVVESEKSENQAQ